MPTNTYVALDTKTIAVATNTVTFDLTGITGYRDLVLVTSGTVNSSSYFTLRFNSDTGSNYSETSISGDGSTSGAYRNINQTYMLIGGIRTTPTIITTHIMSYSNSTTNKSVISRSDNAAVEAAATMGLWRNSSAITSIECGTGGANTFSVGTTFSLYGIAAGVAVATTAKATGGTITFASDGYTYHTFTGGGAFVPNTNLTDVDYLVVAGGGGGSNTGAGGGAGGLRSTMYQTGGGGALESKLSLTSGVSYTVTVGGGGAGDSATAVGQNSVFGSITALGGGCGGGNQAGKYNGVNGGSGGGARNDTGGVAGTGTTGQGFAGSASQYGGGGGAGSTGGFGLDWLGSRGGIGANLSVVAAITGTGASGYYAGGGSGISSAIQVPGGLGGGGEGALYPAQGTNGTANTGGGGGASSNPSFATGGSGIVIIRYAN
jgi:hypothetical protein